ncbi:MAG: hypothetical protein GQ525_14955 [Draconibacterium sp.]|nr:hypothetical protein [Draconibacterium sp.]
MIKLEIRVRPKSIKYLEFKQTLVQIKGDLEKHCTRIYIIEKAHGFFITAHLESNQQLTDIINSKEISILLGAIKILCEKSKTIIHNNCLTSKTTDLKEIRLNYQKELNNNLSNKLA